ncbi:hypothetical protein Ddc_17526 [Ditylenchus destructor]|nr:hypothetical protein Ddc_17526 [Ditylenchus destructor]
MTSLINSRWDFKIVGLRAVRQTSNKQIILFSRFTVSYLRLSYLNLSPQALFLPEPFSPDSFSSDLEFVALQGPRKGTAVPPQALSFSHFAPSSPRLSYLRPFSRIYSSTYVLTHIGWTTKQLRPPQALFQLFPPQKYAILASLLQTAHWALLWIIFSFHPVNSAYSKEAMHYAICFTAASVYLLLVYVWALYVNNSEQWKRIQFNFAGVAVVLSGFFLEKLLSAAGNLRHLTAQIYLRQNFSSSSRFNDSRQSERDSRTLFVTGLSKDTTVDSLRKYF